MEKSLYGCKNLVDVKFSDYSSSDPEKQMNIKKVVKFWSALVKQGYVLK